MGRCLLLTLIEPRKPLTSLPDLGLDKAAKKSIPFVWTRECKKVFRQTREPLIAASLLCPYDLSKGYFCGLTPGLAEFSECS